MRATSARCSAIVGAAQAGIAAIQGENRTWFAGAWLRNGFHEDGVASALRIARAMGATP